MMQTQSPDHRIYTGTIQCIRTIVAKESVRGLYRGLSSPMAGVALVNAIVFGVYGNVQKRWSDPESLQSHFWAGTTAGLIQSIITSPMELAKTRMQMQTQQTTGLRFHGPMDCVRHIHLMEGVRGLYRGFGITAIRDVPGFASYFVLYEMMMRKSPNPGAFHTLMAGGMAGVFSWVLTLPIDVVKTRLQSDGTSTVSRYAGITDCVRQSYRSEGMSFLTRGMSSTLIRAFLMNSVCFYVVAFTIRICDQNKINMDIGYMDSIAVSSQTSEVEPIVPAKHPVRPQHMSRTAQFDIGQKMQYMSALSDAIAENEMIELSEEESNEDDQLEENYYQVCTDIWTLRSGEIGVSRGL